MPATAERNISTSRLLYLLALFVVFLSGTLILSVQNRVLLDELICIAIFTVSFWGVLVLYLMRKRLTEELNYSGTSYKRVFIYITLCWIIEFVANYIPEFVFPIGFIVFFLATFFDTEILFGLGLYFCIMLCMICGRGTYTLYCYCLLLIVNVFLSVYMRELPANRTRVRLCAAILTGVYNAFIPGIFYYFTYNSLDYRIMLVCCVPAVLTVIFSLLLLKRIWDYNNEELYTTCETLLEDDYPLIADLKRYSMVEYNHARKVSYLSEICAREIGCDERICACAGMYYRLGKLLGKPEIENAVKEATNRCFPPAVIAILGEFDGKKRLPQSQESAVVHMVDTIVTKIEVLNSAALSSEWNQEMLIYQTLNEFSNDGIYDQSGISMNQFLLIREVMAHQNIGEFI